MPTKPASAQSSDEYGILSAIWILSCNDENPIMTYYGIKHRLGLPQDFDVRNLVEAHGEMFRVGVPDVRLERWKQELLEGQHLPAWIREKEHTTEREAAIRGITSNDVFCNQFRTYSNSPRSPIEIINWGLEHIDRIRKINTESREEKVKKLTVLWIPIFSNAVAFLSTIVALVAVIVSYNLQIRNIDEQRSLHTTTLNEQRELKYYEVELESRLNGYSSFADLLVEASNNVSANTNALNNSLRRIESTYYNIEPFLVGPRGDWRTSVWDKYQQFASICRKLKDQPVDTQERALLEASLTEQRTALRSELSLALFGQ